MALQSPQTMMGEAVIVSCSGAIWKTGTALELACAAHDQLQSQRYLADRSGPVKLLEKALSARPSTFEPVTINKERSKR